jgi:protein SCO1/2
MAMQRRHALIALLGFAAAGCGQERPHFRGIDVAGADYGRDFRLTDPDGKVRTLADFRGRYVMLFFGFTQCPDVCPTALARAAEVRKRLGADAQRIQVVFVTIDPERDLAPVLKAYTTAFDPGFLGLRGDLEETAATAREFRAFYRKVPTGGSYTMDHSAFTYVFDPDGRLRLLLRHDQTAEDYVADLKTLMHTASNPA